ncbi:MAG: MBOAT family protein [Verrucomicrobia bacterium]|nr:MBOAT family protein [Verrucomicrobiota bacterium]
MVFSSHLFLFYFLPLALVLYFAVPIRWRNLVLTLVSYGFYGWANPLFVLIMLTTTVIDYICGLVLANPDAPFRKEPGLLQEGGPRSRAQKTALVVSLTSNLVMLGFFKYFNFGMDTVSALVNSLGVPGLSLDLAFKVTLPLGISFYTFQSMSYAIDVYRGHAKAIRSFTDFACFVSMFPQLVAGPIVRFSQVAEQLKERMLTMDKFGRGVAFFSIGMLKKILLANPCGKVADVVFNAASAGVGDSWLGAVAYAFQIYFDFSAYSDMAIGLGLMTGFVFAKNFDSPYLSESITEFWRRWHLSLSTWLRDYLYIPLGGNRKGSMRTYVNLFIVMLLGGLWHGAAWNFVVWGGIHGAMLSLERLRGKHSIYERLPRAVRIATTFVIVLFSWVFFRADGLQAALEYCGRMLGIGAAGANAELLGGVVHQPYYVLTVAACAIVAWACPQTWDWTRRLTWPKAAAVVAALWISIMILTTQAYNPFIYFIF